MWVWASILTPDPRWTPIHGGCVPGFYPPKATADYTCDRDGVPENPEPRAYTREHVQSSTILPAYYLLEMVVTRHGFEFKVYTPGPHLGFSGALALPGGSRGGRATRYEEGGRIWKFG